MFKRIMIALAGLFAVLGIAALPASAGPAATTDGSVLAAAATDVFRAWEDTTIAYDGVQHDAATGVAFNQAVNFVGPAGATNVVRSAALIDTKVQVQLFSGVRDEATGTCGGNLVGTLSAAHMADSGYIDNRTNPAAPQRTELRIQGARCYIATVR